jgi:branched-chain amino acid transport system substrate-binding protein
MPRPLSFVVLTLAATFAASPLAAAEPYKLGVALGFTGTGSAYSQEGLRGIEIAVDEINATGGMLGRHPIELVVRNTRTRPDAAKIAVRSMIDQDRVRAVIGTYSSATALAIKPILREAKVLHVATISNAEEITLHDPSPYTFSVVPNTYMMSKATVLAAAKLVGKHGWKKYATITSDYEWGRSNQRVQVALMAVLAPEVKNVGAFWPPLGETAFNGFITAIRKAKPDFVLASIAGTDNAYWLRDVRDYRFDDDIAIVGGLFSVVELQREGTFIKRGTYGRTRAPFFAHLNVPVMASFVETFRKRHGHYPSDWAVLSYDGVMALKQGIDKAGTIESERVKDALKGLEIETARGRLRFRDIDNQLNAPAYVGRVADDPRYRFPIYADLTVFPGHDIWRPEEEIRNARKK